MPEEVTANFPQKLEVTFTFSLTASDQEEKDCWVDSTGKASIDAIADLFDMLCDNGFIMLDTINGYTFDAIKQALADRE